MQNKSNFVKSHYIASNNRYYRSIKYNITQTAGFNPNSTAYIDPNKSTFHNNSKTYATAWRKPTSFSEHKTKKSKLVENIENN